MVGEVMCGVLEFKIGSFRVSDRSRRGCHFLRIDATALLVDPSPNRGWRPWRPVQLRIKGSLYDVIVNHI
jgi:hypothetical protein